MPLDLPATVRSAAMAVIRSAVSAYNADVAADRAAVPPGPLAGCRTVDPQWVLDDGPPSSADGTVRNGRDQARLAAGEAAGWPRVELHLTGVQQQRASTRTFGMAAGGCDGIVPVVVTLRERIAHPPEVTADSLTTPLEGYVDQSWAAAYPKLGLPYGSDFTRRSDRREMPVGNGKQIVRDTVVTVTLAPYLSEMR